MFFENAPALSVYSAQLRELAHRHSFSEIRVSHSEKPLPFSFIAYYADFLERVTWEKSTATDFPNHGKTVYEYKEDGAVFGLPSIAVYFCKESLFEEESK